MSGRKVWVLTYNHRHGTDIRAFSREPSEEEVQKILTGMGYEPEREDEYHEIMHIDVEELPGA